ncbi:MAG: alpha/beta hydrolase [Prevotella sp.]|jgi:acetyl esterase/lipase|nr:alpha/beta hydrolase [Prevotella sp.]MCH3994833.1 alpha/beta hydrolase [Prevotella sp.]
MKRIFLLILCACAVLFGFEACTHTEKEKPDMYVNTKPAPDVDSIADIRYKSVGDSALRLTIYSLKNDTASHRPVLVYIHGGSWVHGNKSWIWSHYQQALTETFLRAHYAVIAIDYRLADGWRKDAFTELSDCRDALVWISRNAGKYHLDIRRIGLWGTSAGAHLALLIGSDSGSPVPIRFILDDYGPTNLNSLFHTELPAFIVSLVKIVKPDLVEKRKLMLRVFPDDSPQRLSPVNRIHKGMPPILISHGDNDETVPVKQAYELEEHLKAVQVPYRLRIYPGEKHGLYTLTKSQVSDMARYALVFANHYNR